MRQSDNSLGASIHWAELDSGSRADSRQQLVEILGLSWFLQQRRRLLERGAKSATISAIKQAELGRIEHALRPISDAQMKEIPQFSSLHSTEAACRIRRRLRSGGRLVKADLEQFKAMQLYPEDKHGAEIARRAAFLHAVVELDLASAVQAAQYEELRVATCSGL